MCVLLLVTLCQAPLLASQSNKVNINGKNLELGSWIVFEGGSSYIPRSVIANLYQGKDLKQNLPIKKLYNTDFVPLKKAFEGLGARVHWEEKTKTIVVTGNQFKYSGESTKALLQEPLAESRRHRPNRPTPHKAHIRLCRIILS